MPYYDDDGNELNPDLVPKPALCTMCMNDDDPHEEILCTLTRFDYRDGEEFKCFAFESKWGDDGNPKPPRPPRPAPPWATSSERSDLG